MNGDADGLRSSGAWRNGNGCRNRDVVEINDRDRVVVGVGDSGAPRNGRKTDSLRRGAHVECAGNAEGTSVDHGNGFRSTIGDHREIASAVQGDAAWRCAYGDCLHHRVPLNFLMMVKFVAPRNATGMEVADISDVLPDRGDEIALHDLHVVDVI